jgi:glycosyltransferase involved in cell wall biosynthesis
MLRIGYVAPSLFAGGAERWILSLARALDPARFTHAGIAVVDPNIGCRQRIAEAEALGPVLTGPRAPGHLLERCDAIPWWGVPIPPYRPRRCRIIYVQHSCHSPTAGFRRADAWVAVSRAARLAIPPPIRHDAKCRVLLNGTDPARVVPTRDRATMRRDWGVPPGSLVLGCLQRVAPEKRPEALAEAVRELPEPWVGVLVGGGIGEWSDRVIERAKRVAPGRVFFPGIDFDVGSVLGAFDIFLLPSHSEGASLALNESWQAGVPAVATPVGIAPEFPGCATLLPERPTARDIADAVLGLWAAPNERARMIRAAREVAVDTLSARAFGDRWGGYLEELCFAPAGKARV